MHPKFLEWIAGSLSIFAPCSSRSRVCPKCEPARRLNNWSPLKPESYNIAITLIVHFLTDHCLVINGINNGQFQIEAAIEESSNPAVFGTITVCCYER